MFYRACSCLRMPAASAGVLRSWLPSPQVTLTDVAVGQHSALAPSSLVQSSGPARPPLAGAIWVSVLVCRVPWELHYTFPIHSHGCTSRPHLRVFM